VNKGGITKANLSSFGMKGFFIDDFCRLIGNALLLTKDELDRHNVQSIDLCKPWREMFRSMWREKGT
jgi:hypothetical protein